MVDTNVVVAPTNNEGVEGEILIEASAGGANVTIIALVVDEVLKDKSVAV